MKKISLLSIFLLAITFVFAQTDVVVTIDVNNSTDDITDVMFKGVPSGWANIQGYDDGTNGDATAGDGIWSATFMDVACDGATANEWGAVDQNDTWLMSSLSANLAFMVDAQCLTTGDTDFAIPAPQTAVSVTLTVTDLNADIGGIQIKGAYGGWTSVAAFDDGTNGDMMAGDNIWTLMVDAEMAAAGETASYEWGAERTDCASPAWIIQGANRVFEVDDQGNVSGETNYDVPLAATTYPVTFRVYMGNEIVSADGVFVSGEFETCPWSKQDIQLMPNAVDPLIYEATTDVAPGNYKWKFFNGFPGTDDGGENNGGTPFATVFQDEGCGVDNGFGGSNRENDLSGLTEATVLPAFIFNSCSVYTSSSNSNVLDLNQFDITPNPASSVAMIEFTNDDAAAFDLIISDVTGKAISTRNNITDNRVEISVADLAPGMYFATLRNEEGATTTRKLMVR